jgi:photosystem II stability/assembly factor-like uncharacterized protein
MKRFLIILYLVFNSSIQLNCGWQEKDLGLDLFAVLNDITFFDNNGWIVGSRGLIMHTSDGGETWIQQISNTNDLLSRVFFLDNNMGWIAGRNSILKTSDGGQNWIKCQIGEGYGINSIYMLDDSTGWAVGEGGWVYHTVDGFNWSQQPGMINLPFLDLDFASKNKGVIIGSLGDFHYIVNGKLSGTWFMLSSDLCYQNIFFIDSLVGWVAGYNNHEAPFSERRCILLRTEDAGENWDFIAQAPSASFRNLHFLSRDEGWIVTTDGSIYYTNNGGFTLTKQYQNTQVYWNGVYFNDNRKGWVVGSKGALAYYDESIGINDKDNISFEANIYPNPVEDNTSINISLSKNNMVTIEIYDAFGNNIMGIFNNFLPNGETIINTRLSELTQGFYFLKIQSGMSTKLIKFVKI